jgi:hypothetical protein
VIFGCVDRCLFAGERRTLEFGREKSAKCQTSACSTNSSTNMDVHTLTEETVHCCERAQIFCTPDWEDSCLASYAEQDCPISSVISRLRDPLPTRQYSIGICRVHYQDFEQRLRIDTAGLIRERTRYVLDKTEVLSNALQFCVVSTSRPPKRQRREQRCSGCRGKLTRSVSAVPIKHGCD